MSDAPIGIFDSGMGGLSVMRALMARLPNESFVYLGDTARLPYGTKSGDTVTRYAVQAAGALIRRQDVKMLVIACNTASAVALPALAQIFAPMPVMGVIAPGAEAALAAAGEGPIAVIATEGTVTGGAYLRAIAARAPGMRVLQQACPLFVAMAEEGLVTGDIAELVAEHYLSPLFAAARPTALVLGCTHFPALAPTLAKVADRLAGPVTLVDSAVTTAEAVAQCLAERGLARPSDCEPRHRFLVTDAPERFARVGEIFLGRAPVGVQQIDIRQDQ